MNNTPNEVRRLRRITRWTITLMKANRILEGATHKSGFARVTEARRMRAQALAQLESLGPWPVLTEEVEP